MNLSIIIPTYNVEPYIESCLHSIFSQRISSFEVICVNDGSTDNSSGIIENYQNKYHNIYLINQSNQGLSSARNTGLNKATGDYVFFLDSDDYLLNDHVLGDILCLSENNNVDICVFNAMINGENKYIEPFPTYKNALIGPKLMKLFYTECNTLMIPIWGHLYRRKFLLDNNLFFEEGLLHEDILFSPIAQYLARRAISIDIPVVNYRAKRPGAITTTPTKKHYNDRLLSARTLYKWFRNINTSEDEPYRFIFSVYDELILELVKNNINTHDFLCNKDFMIMSNCCRTIYEYRLNKLAKLNPKVMALYQNGQMPTLFRHFINHFF